MENPELLTSRPSPQTRAEVRGRLLFWIVGIVGLIGSIWGWIQVNTSMELGGMHRFKSVANTVSLQIEKRLLLYEQAVRGVAALYAASKSVEPEEFRAYVNSLQMDQKYPGLLALSYNRLSRNPNRCVVTYIEPTNSINTPMLGFDIYANAERREAVDLAIERGEVSITRSITLQNAMPGDRKGFLLICPVYANGQSIRNSEERIRAAEGVIVAVIHLSSLVESLERPSPKGLFLSVSEIDTGTHRSLIYQDPRSESIPLQEHPFNFSKKIPVANRHWSIDIQSLPTFDDKMGAINPQNVLATGCIITALLLIGVIRDWKTSEKQQQTEGALQASERRFQALTEIAPVGIFRTDDEGRYTYINHYCSELMGLRQEQATGDQWKQALHPEDRDRVMTAWREAVKHRRLFLSEYRLVRPDGKTSWVLGRALCESGPGGEIRGFIGTLTDITERRRLSEEQLKISKLESIGVLAGGIAHDFNNLLTPILANLSFLKSMVPSGDQTQEYLVETEQAAVRARDLTHQLLTFSKGGTPIKRAAHLKDLIQESIRFALHGRNVTLELNIQEQLSPVEVDAGQLSQVLQNLAINAAQAMPNGGTFRVRANNVTAVEHPGLPRKSGSFVQIDLEDSGTGISPENLSRIFDPYFTTKTDGHGLGLATVFSIIHRHDGMIGVSSTVGKGTTFSIFLPATPTAAPDAPKKTAELSRGRGKILVMDDESEIRSTISRVLNHLGYEVFTAENGEEAIDHHQKALKKNIPFDVTLMDLTIRGGMGGKEAAQKIKALNPNSKLVVFSGYSEDPVMAHYHEFGFCAALKKPFTAQDLSHLLDELTPSQPPVSTPP